jgi:hypothetical protein
MERRVPLPHIAIAVAFLVALTGGWVWGAASGRRAIERESQASALRLELVEGHRALREARLGLDHARVGDARRHLEAARDLLGRANQRLTSLGLTDDVRHMRIVLAGIDEAQRLIARLDASPNAGAGETARAFDSRLDATRPR